MRILIATGLYPPDIGGPATYTKFLERHMPEQGISLVVAPFSVVRRYPKIIRNFLYLIILLWKARGVDCVYALDTVSVGVPALITSFLMRKELYLRVPGDYAWEQGQQRFGITETLDEYLVLKDRPWGVVLLAWFQYRVAEYATKIVVPSEYMKEVVATWGIPREKIFRVYSTLSPMDVPETKEEIRTRFGYEGFVISTAARLVPWKGVEVLINSARELRRTGIEATLEIMGDGVLQAQLVEHVQKIGAQSYVHFRGMVNKQELAERVKASDVFVLNTSYEGLSHQLLEVMDIGTPIITTPVGGNVELITEGKEGLLIPFNDTDALVHALTTLRTDAALRTSLTKNAQEKVAQFREDVIIPELVNVFA